MNYFNEQEITEEEEFKTGLIYKMTDQDTGYFYIGMCRSYKDWINGYFGSGTKWKKYLHDHHTHTIKREILETGFANKRLVREAEVREIRKYCSIVNNLIQVTDPYCMNIETGSGPQLHSNIQYELLPVFKDYEKNWQQSFLEYCNESSNTYLYSKFHASYNPELNIHPKQLPNKYKLTLEEDYMSGYFFRIEDRIKPQDKIILTKSHSEAIMINELWCEDNCVKYHEYKAFKGYPCVDDDNLTKFMYYFNVRSIVINDKEILPLTESLQYTGEVIDDGYLFVMENKEVIIHSDAIKYLCPSISITSNSLNLNNLKNIGIFIKANSRIDKKDLNAIINRAINNSGKLIIYNPYLKYNAWNKSSLNKTGQLKGQAIGNNVKSVRAVNLKPFVNRATFTKEEFIKANPNFEILNERKLTVNMITKLTGYFYNRFTKRWYVDQEMSSALVSISNLISFQYKNHKHPRYMLFFKIGCILRDYSIDQSYLKELYHYAAQAMDVTEADYDRYWNRILDGFGCTDESEYKEVHSSKKNKKATKDNTDSQVGSIVYKVNGMSDLDQLPIWFVARRNPKTGKYQPAGVSSKGGFMTKREAGLLCSGDDIIGFNMKGLNLICFDLDSTEEVNKYAGWLNKTYAEVGYKDDGEMSAHMFFLTDKVWKTSHIGKCDILANGKYQLCYVKPNKQKNRKRLQWLPDELVKELKS